MTPYLPWLEVGGAPHRIDLILGTSNSFWVITASLLLYKDDSRRSALREVVPSPKIHIVNNTINATQLATIVTSTVTNHSGVISGILSQTNCVNYSITTTLTRGGETVYYIEVYKVCTNNTQSIFIDGNLTVTNTTHSVWYQTLLFSQSFKLVMNQVTRGTATPNVVEQYTQASLQYDATQGGSRAYFKVHSQDTMLLNEQQSHVLATYGASSGVSYDYHDLQGNVYGREIRSINNTVTSDHTGQSSLQWTCDPFVQMIP